MEQEIKENEALINTIIGYLKKFTGATKNGDLCYSGTQGTDDPEWYIDCDKSDAEIAENIFNSFQEELKSNEQLKIITYEYKVFFDYFRKCHQYVILFRDKETKEHYSLGFDIVWECCNRYYIHWYAEPLEMINIVNLAVHYLCEVYTNANYDRFCSKKSVQGCILHNKKVREQIQNGEEER